MAAAAISSAQAALAAVSDKVNEVLEPIQKSLAPYAKVRRQGGSGKKHKSGGVDASRLCAAATAFAPS